MVFIGPPPTHIKVSLHMHDKWQCDILCYAWNMKFWPVWFMKRPCVGSEANFQFYDEQQPTLTDQTPETQQGVNHSSRQLYFLCFASQISIILLDLWFLSLWIVVGVPIVCFCQLRGKLPRYVIIVSIHSCTTWTVAVVSRFSPCYHLHSHMWQMWNVLSSYTCVQWALSSEHLCFFNA